MFHQLAEAALGLSHAVCELTQTLKSHRSDDSAAVTKADLNHAVQIIITAMASKIAEFAAAQNAFNDRQDAAISDLAADIKSLDDQIAALQATSGAITPEDQALLDGIQARSSAVSDKLDALNALTAPVVPITP